MAGEEVEIADVFGARVQELRKLRGISAQGALAERVDRLGVPMTRDIVANLELGRRGRITVEELLAFAVALNVSPTNLIVPDDESVTVHVTPEVSTSGRWLRSWFYGRYIPPEVADALDGGEVSMREFMEAAPERERREWAARDTNHPALMQLLDLESSLLTAVAGEARDRVFRRPLAEHLRESYRRLGAAVEELASELENEAEEDPELPRWRS